MRKDESKTKAELIAELNELRSRVENSATSDSERKAAMEKLKFRNDLENLITNTSTNFINLESDMIDQGIERTLKDIGKFFKTDRTYIFLYSADGLSMTNTHEWCAENISSQKHRLQDMASDALPWFDKRMKAFKTVYAPRLDKLPKEAKALRDELIAEEIKSLLCVPMVCRNHLVGFVGFDSVKHERCFTSETIISLRMLGEIFANALDRKGTGTALRESEKIYRTLVENVIFGVALVNSDLEVIMANEAMGNLFDKNVNDMIGHKCHVALMENDDFCQGCPGAISMETGLPNIHEKTVTRKDGSTFDMYIRALPILRENGKASGFIEIIEDITERKKNEKALMMSEANYRAIFDSASDAIFVHDVETGAILDFNQKACDLFGYDRQEMKEIAMGDLGAGTPPYTQNDIMKRFAEAMVADTNRFEWLCRDKQGKQFWAEIALKKADIGGVDRLLAVIRDISERKRAELSLYMSEQRFRAIADYTYDWEIWVSPGGRPLWTNPAVERVAGYTCDECMGMFDFPKPIVHPDDLDALHESLRNVEHGDSGNDLEFRLRRKNGEFIWASVSWQAIYDKKNISQGYRASIRDISERKHAEEAIISLAEGTARTTGEDFLRTLVNHLASALDCRYVLVGELLHEDIDRIRTLAVWANGSVADNFEYDLAGTPCENIVGKSVCIYPSDVQEHFPDNHLLAEMGAISYLGVPLFNSNGQGIGLLAAIDDKPMEKISLAESLLTIYATRAAAEMERKIAENAIRESESRYRLLFEVANDAIFIMEKDEFIDCNERTLEMFGCSREQIIGQPPYRFSPTKQPDGRDSTEKAIEKIKAALDGNPQFFEWRHTKYDGTPFEAEVSLNRLDIGEDIYLQAMVRDITDRKQAQGELERLVKTVAEKNEELESIVYVSSHDLRSPLINIEGFSVELSLSCDQISKWIKDTKLPPETIKHISPLLDEYIPESIKFIRASVEKMDMLLSGLLRLCRVGRADLNLQTLNMNRMVGHIVKATQFQINRAELSVSVGDLPDCIGDLNQINQVFTNLIDNAIKYCGPEKESKIEITGRVENGMAVYCIQDNGIGILPRHQEIVFEIFHRLEPDNRIKGEGLGLTIVKRIVSRHGGNIRLESKLGQGSSFYVSLPIQQD